VFALELCSGTWGLLLPIRVVFDHLQPSRNYANTPCRYQPEAVSGLVLVVRSR